jgi:hypothetical protein
VNIRTIALRHLMLALCVIACAAPQVQSDASVVATSSPRVTSLAASASLFPTPAATESPSASPSAVAAKELEIRWKAGDPAGLGPVTSIIEIARFGHRYVLIGELPYRDEGSSEAAAWWSADGRSWELAQEFPAGQRILALTAGGPGFVAAGFNKGGAAVWTSIDGRRWQPVSDPSLRHGVIGRLVATSSGLVGFGWRSDSDASGLYTSPDGYEWLAATNESGLRVARGLHAVAAYDGRAVAFVSGGDGKPDEIWETTGRAEWERTGALRDIAIIEKVAGGSRGWVALDGNMAWTSSDGRSWSKGVRGPDVAADAVVDDSGFVAVGWVGSLPGETCGDQRPFAGHTWTSSDGRTWQRMPVAREFKAAMVTRLLVVDRTLIGFGGRLGDGETMMIGRWTARLPDVSRPAVGSDKASVPVGCGG